MVEWFKASVLKTDEGQLSGGSNPPLSAIFLLFTYAEIVMDLQSLIRDINLILAEKESKGIKSMSPRPTKDEKYLKKDEKGVYRLVFRVPARFGGRPAHHSLFPNDHRIAALIRARHPAEIPQAVLRTTNELNLNRKGLFSWQP